MPEYTSRVIRRLTLILLAVCATSASAQTIRPLATDRPTRTDTPYTVPHGWLQFEADFVTHGEFTDDSLTVTGTGVVPFNVKYGVTRRLDLEFVFVPWLRTRTDVAGLVETDDGTGPAGLRGKFNLIGNNITGAAVAVLPYAFIPTRGDNVFDSVTWGVNTPVSLAVGSSQTLSSMLGVSRVNNDEWWFTGAFCLSSALFGNLSGFLETYVSRAGFSKDADEDVTIDAGLVYLAARDWQFDAGVYYGASELTEDWRVFVGLSGRLRLVDWSGNRPPMEPDQR